MKEVSHVLNEKLIKVDVEANTWQEFMKTAGNPGNLLLKENLIEEEYIDSIIDPVYQFGSYMIMPLMVLQVWDMIQLT
ncbi:hypothetical protein [Fervidibacillus halotolerans]|uniref:Uncharacterized protein n=1 Tax=Fervidibacillus halotolerans TaxID=2980027 RepID=A0A9E8RWG2_9BACI|nr:hypothetical protein [Fervidibacillus halotolerans]WAA11715.1 hypothetical protein OE105_08780 [Fervidibacillus halotolerans]